MKEAANPKNHIYTKYTMLLLFLRGSNRFFSLSILASAMVAALDMVTPQVIRVVVDGCLSNQTETLPGFARRFLEEAGGREFIIRHLYLAALAILVVAALTAVFQYLNTYLNSVATERMMKTARDTLYAHIERLPYAWHMENQTGDIIQRCTSDVNMVREFVSEQLVQVIRIAVLIAFSVLVMATMSLTLSWVVFLSIPIIIGYSYFFYHRIGHLFLECDENESVLSTIAQENLTGVRVVRAFGRESYERERFRKQNHVYTDAWMRLCALLSGFWAAGDLVMALQLLLLVVVGTVLCVRGSLTAGMLIAFISYNRRLIWPVRRLGRMISEMSKAGVSMEIHTCLCPDMGGDIVFRDVSFAYTDNETILRDISLTIPGGTTLGILGGTGSGKSTLMHLLNRLYELQEGDITVSGVSVKDISLPWLRSHIGMVLQEPYLFSRTIGENIAITKSEAAASENKTNRTDTAAAADTANRTDIAAAADTASMADAALTADHVAAENSDAATDRTDVMEEVRRAARVACIDESIRRFSKGYQTIVGERGVTLSGGQKQRTAIARMLLQNTPIMVFDDSLSAVDTETDEKIRNALKQYMGHATVILISHRISTLMDADQIIVLEHGRIAQRGTHRELIAREGLYREIYEIQSPESAEDVG